MVHYHGQDVGCAKYHPSYGVRSTNRNPRCDCPRADRVSRSRMGMVAIHVIASNLDMGCRLSQTATERKSAYVEFILPYLTRLGIRDTMGWRTQTIPCCLSRYFTSDLLTHISSTCCPRHLVFLQRLCF